MERKKERGRPRQKGRRRGGEKEGGKGEKVRRRRAHLLEKQGNRQIRRWGF
jgi:hypothetical protein